MIANQAPMPSAASGSASSRTTVMSRRCSSVARTSRCTWRSGPRAGTPPTRPSTTSTVRRDRAHSVAASGHRRRELVLHPADHHDGDRRRLIEALVRWQQSHAWVHPARRLSARRSARRSSNRSPPVLRAAIEQARAWGRRTARADRRQPLHAQPARSRPAAADRGAASARRGWGPEPSQHRDHREQRDGGAEQTIAALARWSSTGWSRRSTTSARATLLAYLHDCRARREGRSPFVSRLQGCGQRIVRATIDLAHNLGYASSPRASGRRHLDRLPAWAVTSAGLPVCRPLPPAALGPADAARAVTARAVGRRQTRSPLEPGGVEEDDPAAGPR